MESIWREAQGLSGLLTALRRDLHRYPETGWTEFRTAGLVITELRRLGYQVRFGPEVLDAASMMGVPAAEELAAAEKRAIAEGADPELVEAMRGGMTGVVATLDGLRPGRTVAFRFDMDANDVEEARDEDHRPAREGFASRHSGAMHACGHDGHVAIGLGAARLLAANRQRLAGRVKLLFQPAEEGVRGAMAMARAGAADDADYFFGGHIGFGADRSGLFVAMCDGLLATTKLDAAFKGVAAHAGAAPETGKNALLAAAQAAVSLSTIARHGGGASRINVGVLHAGSGRNVVADSAFMKLETRGLTTEINDYMAQEARRMLEASARMYDVKLEISEAGSAPSCRPDPELGREVAALIREKCGYQEVLEHMELGCSEDCAWFMQRVERLGGRAAYMLYGSELASGHHSSRFDFDEDCLWRSAASVAEIALFYAGS